MPTTSAPNMTVRAGNACSSRPDSGPPIAVPIDIAMNAVPASRGESP